MPRCSLRTDNSSSSRVSWRVMSLVFASRWSISRAISSRAVSWSWSAADVLYAVAAAAEHGVPPLVALLHREQWLFHFGLNSFAGFLQWPFDFSRW